MNPDTRPVEATAASPVVCEARAAGSGAPSVAADPRESEHRTSPTSLAWIATLVQKFPTLVSSARDYRIHPPTIDRFLTDPNFLGPFASGLAPVWRAHLPRIFDPRQPVFEVAFTGPDGSGKTRAGLVAQLFVLCQLLCLRDPQRYFGLLPGAIIEIGLFSGTRALARDDLYAPFRSALQTSPFFRPYLTARGRRRPGSIQLTDSSLQVVEGSDLTHALGQSFRGALVDLPPRRARSVPVEAATNLYLGLRARMLSRSMVAGQVQGLLVLCVSPAYAPQFESHVQGMRGQPRCYVASFA